MEALPRAAVVVAVPSPPMGEGSEAFPRMMMGEGGEPLGPSPSPNRVCWTSGAVLSHRGEGAIMCAGLAAALPTIVRAI
jgi:hypothetical protein